MKYPLFNAWFDREVVAHKCWPAFAEAFGVNQQRFNAMANSSRLALIDKDIDGVSDIDIVSLVPRHEGEAVVGRTIASLAGKLMNELMPEQQGAPTIEQMEHRLSNLEEA